MSRKWPQMQNEKTWHVVYLTCDQVQVLSSPSPVGCLCEMLMRGVPTMGLWREPCDILMKNLPQCYTKILKFPF